MRETELSYGQSNVCSMGFKMTLHSKTSDEDLLKELHECCNPNCLVIAEIEKRYNNKKNECDELNAVLKEGAQEMWL